jgi:flagellar biosynthesis/type III secretory pathway chaperone
VEDGSSTLAELVDEQDHDLQPFKNILVNNVRCLASFEAIGEQIQSFGLQFTELLSSLQTATKGARRGKWMVEMQ